MRRLLSRVGLAGLLLVLVAVIVVVARLFGDGSALPPASTGPAPSITVDPSAGDDGLPDVTDQASAPEDGAVAETVLAFMSAWLDRDLSAEAWHDQLVPLATPSLADKLSGVDPLSIPATRTTGPPEIIVSAAIFARVSVPVDSGTVTLNLAMQDDRWLVDAVDWARP